MRRRKYSRLLNPLFGIAALHKQGCSYFQNLLVRAPSPKKGGLWMLWCIVYIVSLITGLVSAPKEIEKDKVGEPMALESNAPPLAPAVVTAVKQFEGCSPRAFWDYRQYSIGYGTRALSPRETIDCETEAEQRLIIELGRAQMQVDALGVPLT